MPPLATFVTGVLGVPDTAVPDCGCGKMSGLTVIVTVDSSQFTGVFLSHNWYFKA